MALQDLTPQLRTRLGRLERLVGWFVLLATLLSLAGLGFYIHQTAERKGWFQRKLPYFTFVRSAAGLKVGQPIKLMGLEVGEITSIEPQPPEDSYYDMFVAFSVKEPYEGYLWQDSRARVASSDFLGNRFIELTKGTSGPPSYLFREFKDVNVAMAESYLGPNPVYCVDEIYDDTKTNLLARPLQPLTREVLERITTTATRVTRLRLLDSPNKTRLPTAIWGDKEGSYQPFGKLHPATSKGYFLVPDESPALSERLEKLVNLMEAALPNVLDLTNHIQRVLAQGAAAAGHADDLLLRAQPVMTNLASITAFLTNAHGGLGDWLLPTNLAPRLELTLSSANTLLTNSDSRLTRTALGLDLTIENLANLTSNLHAQVNANTNLVGEVSRLIVHADDLVRG